MSEIELLTPEQVAQRLQVKTRTVQEWLRTGRLAGIKLGKLWRIRASDLMRFLNGEEIRETARAANVLSPEERATRVDALWGKYAHAHSSVDEFYERRREEVRLENRRWEATDE